MGDDGQASRGSGGPRNHLKHVSPALRALGAPLGSMKHVYREKGISPGGITVQAKLRG